MPHLLELAIWEICSLSYLLPYDEKIGVSERRETMSLAEATGKTESYLKKVVPLSERNVPSGVVGLYEKQYSVKLSRGTTKVRELFRECKSLKRKVIDQIFLPEQKEILKAKNINDVSRRLGNIFTRRDDKYQIQISSMMISILIGLGGSIQSQVELEARLSQFEIIGKALFAYALVHSLDVLTEEWKSMTTILQSFYFRNELVDWRELPFNRFQQFLYDTITMYDPELRESLEEPNHKELWFVSHISQSRSMAPPTELSSNLKLLKYIENMTQIDEATKIEAQGAFNLGLIIGEKIRRRARKTKIDSLFKETHLSLSSGSSFEYTREEGGKWKLLEEGGEVHTFLLNPIKENFKLESGKFRDQFGNLVAMEEDGDLPTWSKAYLECQIEGEFADTVYEETIFGSELGKGVDSRLGKLIFLWALMKKKVFDDQGSILCGKLIVITEPGCKIRPLTSGEAWAYLYMIPAAHFFTDVISLLPGARVGLKESDGLWRMGMSYHNHYGDLDREELPEFISTSDLESATDFANREISSQLMKGIADSLGQVRSYDDRSFAIPKSFMNYLKEAVGLLCSDRIVEIRRVSRTLGKKLTSLGCMVNNRIATMHFKRGVLMGDPICKCVLSASSIGAYYAVCEGYSSLSQVLPPNIRQQFRNTKKGSTFACAGDDHTAVGTLEFCKQIPEFLESMHYRISWPKYRISRKYVHYCQDFGFHPNFCSTIKFDTIKLRLLNQFTKGGSRQQFDTPDPLRGKIKEVQRTFNYLLDEKEACNANFLSTRGIDVRSIAFAIPLILRLAMPKFFESKVSQSMVTYMPTRVGGIGVPSRFNYYNDKTANMIAKVRILERLEYEDLSKVKVRTTWERGKEQRTALYNFMELLSLDQVEIKDSETVFTQITEALSVSTMSAAPSKRRVQHQMYKEYIDLSQPNSLLGNKEIPYVAMLRGESKTEKVKPKSRTMAYIRQETKRCNALSKHLDLDFDFDWNRIPSRPGMFISREALLNALEVTNYAPSLFLSKKFFFGKLDLMNFNCDQKRQSLESKSSSG
jgi:hypothetical protein